MAQGVGLEFKPQYRKEKKKKKKKNQKKTCVLSQPKAKSESLQIEMIHQMPRRM
jgi:hypothetical protein